MSIRLSKSTIGENEVDAVTKVLKEEFLGMGGYVQEFEQGIKSYLNTTNEVVCVNTGTSALHLAVEALNLKGCEVLVPTITYVASFCAISAGGAIPVACDVEEDSLFIDLKDAEKRITSKTKAIMAVHYTGDASKMTSVNLFAKKHGLRVIEDAAHSFGSFFEGELVGNRGDIICFSFDGIKNITSGEGGAVVTGDIQVAEYIRNARLLGVEKDTEKRYSGQRSWDFDVLTQGYRYHMSNVMAAIGIEQLKKIGSVRTKKSSLVNYYLNNLAGLKQLQLLDLSYDTSISHIFVIKAERRDELKAFLELNGVACGIHYKPNHLLTFYKSEGLYPIADRLYSEILTIPLHLDLSEEDQAYIVDKIKEFYEFA